MSDAQILNLFLMHFMRLDSLSQYLRTLPKIPREFSKEMSLKELQEISQKYLDKLDYSVISMNRSFGEEMEKLPLRVVPANWRDRSVPDPSDIVQFDVEKDGASVETLTAAMSKFPVDLQPYFFRLVLKEVKAYKISREIFEPFFDSLFSNKCKSMELQKKASNIVHSRIGEKYETTTNY